LTGSRIGGHVLQQQAQGVRGRPGLRRIIPGGQHGAARFDRRVVIGAVNTCRIKPGSESYCWENLNEPGFCLLLSAMQMEPV